MSDAREVRAEAERRYAETVVGTDVPTSRALQDRDAFVAGALWASAALFPGRTEAEVKAEALRDAAQDVRLCWTGTTNLRDQGDPETFHSFDAWLDVRADHIEKGAAGRAETTTATKCSCTGIETCDPCIDAGIFDPAETTTATTEDADSG